MVYHFQQEWSGSNQGRTIECCCSVSLNGYVVEYKGLESINLLLIDHFISIEQADRKACT